MGAACSCRSNNRQPETNVEPIYIRETELLKFLSTEEDGEVGQQDELQQLEINHFVDRCYLAETELLFHAEDDPGLLQLHEQSISETKQLVQSHDPDVPKVQEVNERYKLEINPEAQLHDLAEIEQPKIQFHNHDVSLGHQPGELKQAHENSEFSPRDLVEEKQLILRPLSHWRRMFPKKSLLHAAAIDWNPRRIMRIIEAGANPDARAFSTGDTILHLACKVNALRCAKMLVSVPSPYQVKNRSRILNSLLHITELQMLPKVVAQLIVEYMIVPGADWTLKNSAGKTPLDLIESDWDVSELQMDITKTLNRWNRGGEEELMLFLPERPRAKLTMELASCETTILPLLSSNL